MGRILFSLVVSAGLAAVPAGALAAAGSSSTAAPKSPTPKALLVTRPDLGTGWSIQSPAPRKVPSVGCGAQHLRLRAGAAHPRAAASPTFREGTSGPFVAQTAYEYAKVSQQRQVFAAVARHALLKCLAQTFTDSSRGGVKFTVISERGLGAPRVRARTAAYRVTATATLDSDQSVNAYLDTILVADGKGLSQLSVSSLTTPPPPALERRLAHLVSSALL